MSYDLRKLGSVGRNVSIHESVVIFNPGHVYVGNDVRIDCLAVISAGEAGVFVGNNVHIASMVQIFGSGGRVIFEDFSGMSSRSTVYTASDDYSGETMTNPTVPAQFKHVSTGPVTFRRHALVGCGSVIMPNTELGLGSAVGALTFVNSSVPPFTIVAGSPMKKIADRKRVILELEKQYELARANS